MVVAALGAGALGAGATVSPVSASPAASVSSSPGAVTSGLNAKQKKAYRKAQRKCGARPRAKARKTCRKRVKRKFAALAKPPVKSAPPAATIDVGDDYFAPDMVNINRGDSILWIWNDLNHDPHNINLVTGPPGVDTGDFQTGIAPAVKYRFTRTFLVPGTYDFVCSLHHNMKFKVGVS